MRTLILVQGISRNEDYLREAVIKYPQFKAKYERIVQVKTEDVFDKEWFTKVPVLGNSFTAQYLGDVWQFYTNEAARKKVCKRVRNVILAHTAEGDEVSLLAHSLGTIITLCSGQRTPKDCPNTVKECFLLGSPLGIGNPVARMFTLGHAEKYAKNFKTNKMIYCWSEKDFVSKEITGRAQSILNNATLEKPPFIYHTERQHKAKDYLEFLIVNQLV